MTSAFVVYTGGEPLPPRFPAREMPLIHLSEDYESPSEENNSENENLNENHTANERTANGETS